MTKLSFVKMLLFNPITLICCGLFFLIFSLASIVSAIENRVSFIGEREEIEQLRSDAAKVDSKIAEDVAGQVAQKNQRIKSVQKYRQTIFKIFWPAGWDEIEIIEVPKTNLEGRLSTTNY